MIRRSIIGLTVTLVIMCSKQVSAQDNEWTNGSPTLSAPLTSKGGLYFADVTVRGRPVFQIGSLADISAQDRAAIINRRIAGLIGNRESLGEVTIQGDRNLLTLQFNNRVLMTVTEQDAQDYALGLDELAQNWADRLNQSLQRPPLAIDVIQRLNTTIRQVGRQTIDGIPSFVGAILVIGMTWGVARGVRYGAFTWAQNTEGDRFP